MLEQENVLVRNSKLEDIYDLEQLSTIGFPGLDTFTAEHFTSHIKIFPEGQFCVEFDGKIIGSCTSMIINSGDFNDEDTFDEVTDDSYIRNHNPQGNVLYGVDVVVHPDYRGLKVGQKIYEARRSVCKQFNLTGIVFGGRIPNYHKYADKMNPTEYVQKVLQGNIYDPVLRFQSKQGFVFKGIIPKYLISDHDSLEYATLMEWKNPDYCP